MKRRPEDHVEMRPWVARAFSPGMRVFLFCKAFGNAAGNGETATTSAKAAAKRRQNAAHGVSRGSATAKYSAAQRRKVLQQISAGPNHGLRAFCRPAGAWSSTSLDPRLTPWAAFWRRFAAHTRRASILLMASFLPLAACRQDMHDQPRFKPLRESDFYADLRSARPPVEGTVARGQLHEDAYFYGGKIGNNPGDYMPFAVTADVLARGQERYNIYCAPCHSRLGDGDGTIVQRGFRRPPSFHTDRLRRAPLGYFVDVMTNGFGAMPDYASQIAPSDRWCIVAYIRALQLSQAATVADVPTGQKVPSEPRQLRGDPPSGATFPELVAKPDGGEERR